MVAKEASTKWVIYIKRLNWLISVSSNLDGPEYQIEEKRKQKKTIRVIHVWCINRKKKRKEKGYFYILYQSNSHQFFQECT